MHSSDRILKSVTIYCWCCGSAKPTFPLGKCIQHIAVFKQLFHSYYFALLSCKVGNWTKCIARAFRKVFNYMLYSFMYFIYFIRTHLSFMLACTHVHRQLHEHMPLQNPIQTTCKLLCLLSHPTNSLLSLLAKNNKSHLLCHIIFLACLLINACIEMFPARFPFFRH